MISKLVMYNFKSVEYCEHIFPEGLIALRGRNEAGKSTRFHAILYALFGSRALPLSLAETVTYDRPDSSLKVILEFTFGDVLYHISRSKSGATLTAGTVTANGQAEVTRYVENLFGVNADTASKLMIASQNSLRGALEGNGAVPLIEKLSNLELIDELITKVQEQLPSGNTRSLLAQIEDLQSLTAPVNDLESYQPEIVKAREQLTGLVREFETAKTLLEGIDTRAFQEVINNASLQEQAINTLNRELIQVTDKIKLGFKVFIGDIEGLRMLQGQQRDYSDRLVAYKMFTNLVVTNSIYAPYKGDLDQDIRGLELDLHKVKSELSDCEKDIIRNQGLRINDKECALCGKLLQDVPEVVSKNNEVDEKQCRIQTTMQGHRSIISTIELHLADLRELKVITSSLNNTYNQISKYATKTTDTPPELLWVGNPPIDHPDLTDYSKLIREAEAAKTAATIAEATHKTFVARQEEIEKILATTCAKVYDIASAREKLTQAQALREELNVLIAKKHHVEMLLQEAEHKLKLATSEYGIKLDAYQKAQESIKKFQADVATYDKHNSLIRKLREARPIIATRLWTLVLSSVSTYFSQIRGVPSRVTRADDKFLVDGKPVVGGVSGSTLDSLGLAMRMALGKTFLPSVDFLLLDEPAAGMDDERESAMLGLLASAGFIQTIVVTHSSIADSFASSVIQL